MPFTVSEDVVSGNNYIEVNEFTQYLTIGQKMFITDVIDKNWYEILTIASFN